MIRNLEEAIVSLAGSRELVDKLDEILTDPGDRAYIVCSAEECRNYLLGHCTIHTVKNRKDNPGSNRCRDYVT